ncbi:charged multivesicular body protein 4c-like [Acropora millepora]|uniref:charged multivesicular body protein 4c-like n=1 Tax=Acropora millepora TaxID=45264 RepID=UPI001CF4B1E9|nr:charged multivesicular body protein 4c-like [Acropora millepora]
MLALAVAAFGASGVFLISYFRGKIEQQRPDPTVQDVIEKLRSTKVMLEKRRQCLIDLVAEADRKDVLCNMEAAPVALEKKKILENQVHLIEGMLSTIRFQKEELENANTYKEVFENMSYASKALQLFYKQFDGQSFHDLMADIQEQTELSGEILRAITAELADFGMDYDEDELMNQFQALKQEAVDRELLQIPGTASLESLDK